MRQLKTCPNCQKIFEVPKNNYATKYCCHECSVNHLLRGKPKSVEHRQKIKDNHARYWASHKMTKEHIKKATEGLKPYQHGEKHWNWKGGITPKLISMRFLPKYKQWREAVFQRDDYTCLMCKQKGGKLNADHITPYAKLVYEKNWALLWNIDNGRTLCEDDHRKVDTYARKFKRS